MRLSDAGLHQRRTKALYSNHRFPPWLTEDATRDRSNRWLGHYRLSQKHKSDAPAIAAPNAMLLHPHVYRSKTSPIKNKGTAITKSTLFGRGLRRQLSRCACRSAKNAVTEPNCFARSSSCADVWAGKPQPTQESVPAGELRPQY